MARTPKVVEDRREQIIDAAMSVFAQKGFVKATNKDIAREAGITAGLIYHYFKNKEDLLAAVIETRTPLHVVANLPPQAFALPPEQFFRFLIPQMLNLVEEQKFIAVLRVVLSEVLHSDNQYFASLAPMIIQRILGFLERYLEAKIASGEIRSMNAALTAQVLVGSVIAFVLRRQIVRDPVALQYTQEEIVESVLDVVLKGLLPR
jgi:AcrR family transcriptional regulator